MQNGRGRLGGREVVIVEAVRTPVGRGHPEKGWYKDLHPSNLLAKTYSELIDRAGIDPMEVGDVIAGCVQQWGEQSINIGRIRAKAVAKQVTKAISLTENDILLIRELLEKGIKLEVRQVPTDKKQPIDPLI